MHYLPVFCPGGFVVPLVRGCILVTETAGLEESLPIVPLGCASPVATVISPAGDASVGVSTTSDESAPLSTLEIQRELSEITNNNTVRLMDASFAIVDT